MDQWTKENAELASKQGWEVRDIWCGAKRRIEHQIFKDDKSNIFLTDEAARLWVLAHVANALVQKAMRLVFNSKIGKTK